MEVIRLVEDVTLLTFVLKLMLTTLSRLQPAFRLK